METKIKKYNDSERQYYQEVFDPENNKKCIFAINVDDINIFRLQAINGLYKDEEERLKGALGNVINCTVIQFGRMALSFLKFPFPNGGFISEEMLLKMLRSGILEATWPPFDGSEGIDLIYLGSADKSTSSILAEKRTELRKMGRDEFVKHFKKCFAELKKNSFEDKLIVAPVRIDEERNTKFMVKLGFDFSKMTEEKLLRLYDTTPDDVMSAIDLSCGGTGDMHGDPIDLLMVVVSRVVEVLIRHGEREPWKFLSDMPPWGWPALGRDFGLNVMEVSSNEQPIPGAKITDKNLGKLVRRSLDIADVSNLH